MGLIKKKIESKGSEYSTRIMKDIVNLNREAMVALHNPQTIGLMEKSHVYL
jgi:hypothetical protein